MKIWKYPLLFVVGGGAYVGLEFLYRGRSHITMFAAGGICFLLIGAAERSRLPLIIRGLIGAAIITGVELAAGLAFNRDYGVWDYRAQPGNFRGQICPMFCLLWIPVALGAGYLYRQSEQWIKKRTHA